MSASQPPYTTLISVAQLQALHTSGAPLMVFDCSFDLMQPAAGRALFEDSHIAGAVFADLNDDLSTHSPQFTGRAVNGGRSNRSRARAARTAPRQRTRTVATNSKREMFCS